MNSLQLTHYTFNNQLRPIVASPDDINAYLEAILEVAKSDKNLSNRGLGPPHWPIHQYPAVYPHPHPRHRHLGRQPAQVQQAHFHWFKPPGLPSSTCLFQ